MNTLVGVLKKFVAILRFAEVMCGCWDLRAAAFVSGAECSRCGPGKFVGEGVLSSGKWVLAQILSELNLIPFCALWLVFTIQ